MAESIGSKGEHRTEDPLENKAWYAVHTRSRHERVVNRELVSKGFETFFPTIWTWSRRTDRRLRIEGPMFSGYLFVRTTLRPERHLSLLRTIGVVKLVGFGGQPQPVSPVEIESLNILIQSGQAIHPAENLAEGDLVRIVKGPFKGVVGRLVTRRSPRRLIVSIEILKRAVFAELEDDMVLRAETL